MARHNVLEELELCIKLSATNDPAGSMNSGDLDLHIDKVLTEHGAFPNLRRVYLELRWQLYTFPDDFEIDEPNYLITDKVMRELFPRLCGDLAFGFSFHQVQENGALVDLF